MNRVRLRQIVDSFSRDRQAEIGFRQGSSSAEISNPSGFMISLRSL